MMRRCEWCGWVLLETPEWWLAQCPNQSCSIVAVIIDDPQVEQRPTMRVAYADPPYPGCAHLYKDHPDYAGEVDHSELIERLERDYDGWLLHTNSTTLAHVIRCADAAGVTDYRVMAWVKPFAAFKRNVAVAYAWEPVLVKACRKPVVDGSVVMRDWIAEGITMRRGLTGAKPEAVCRWAFHVLGMERTDTLVDLYPGSGAVGRAFEAWRSEATLFDPPVLQEELAL